MFENVWWYPLNWSWNSKGDKVNTTKKVTIWRSNTEYKHTELYTSRGRRNVTLPEADRNEILFVFNKKRIPFQLFPSASLFINLADICVFTSMYLLGIRRNYSTPNGFAIKDMREIRCRGNTAIDWRWFHKEQWKYRRPANCQNSK